MFAYEIVTWENGVPSHSGRTILDGVHDYVRALNDTERYARRHGLTVANCVWLFRDDKRVAILNIMPNKWWWTEEEG